MLRLVVVELAAELAYYSSYGSKMILMKKKWTLQSIEKLVAQQKAENSREGLHQLFHPNGRLFREWTVVGGKIDGLFREWDGNGNLVLEEPMKKGLAHGIVKQWNSNGRFLGEYTMKMGKGIVREWNADGSLETETEYLTEHLTHVRIYEDASTTHDAFLCDDVPISKQKSYRLLQPNVPRQQKGS